MKACIFIKKRLQHTSFAVNIAKVLRRPILKNICEGLFIDIGPLSPWTHSKTT